MQIKEMRYRIISKKWINKSNLRSITTIIELIIQRKKNSNQIKEEYWNKFFNKQE